MPVHAADDSIAQKLVALYHDALDALLVTPELFADTLFRRVAAIVPCDGIVMIVEPDANAPVEAGSETVAYIHLNAAKRGTPADVQVGPMGPAGERALEGLIAQANVDIATVTGVKFPDRTAEHIHWIRSEREPRVAAGIFRVTRPAMALEEYSHAELATIDMAAPHLLLCVHLYQEHTRARRASFDFFAERCGAVAVSSGLTSTEERVLRKMVEGATNKEISGELSVSLATVKTHISHILQKTGCRNRTDLIGKYFSSKQAVATP